MLKSETLFGKRENLPSGSALNPASTSPPSNPLSGFTKPLAAAPSQTSQATASAAHASSASETGSKLIVGPNIKLKGVEITDCDTLVVEGFVEANKIDSRVIHIAENGAYKGSAECDVAELWGDFDGDMIARVKLVIHATGKFRGKARYGKLVMEEGGELSADVQVINAANEAARLSQLSKPSVAVPVPMPASV